MTKDEGKTRVTENYVILNLHHVEFESVTYEKEEAIPLEQLLGILGGIYIHCNIHRASFL
jgi:hypothetical protein